MTKKNSAKMPVRAAISDPMEELKQLRASVRIYIAIVDRMLEQILISRARRRANSLKNAA